MELKQKSKDIKISILKMLNNAGNGHTGGSLSTADIFTALYFQIMNIDPKNPNDPSRDRLILSNGHVAPVMYASLAHSGYFPVDELMTLRKLNSRLQGHPHMNSAPGIENTAGPLGQGISVAVGHALAAKLDNKDYITYCSLGDGELNEGQVWEAFFSINKFKLNNLICFIDRNKVQLSGDSIDIMPLEPLADKLASFNLNVIEASGHDFDEIITAFESAKNSNKPTIIIFNTIMGKGVSFMEGSYKWHGIAPDDEQTKKAIEEIQNGE
ncbi:transketolase [archaeon]|jgi:transketolase|nr:transketolase [archaeon]MBT4023223.1 transketolase [archaeon]MBT4271893.1 transketolase [archaeon]MBT4460992.1 transketolase [archaeon]MBT4858432.1 transketolase [archaeon]